MPTTISIHVYLDLIKVGGCSCCYCCCYCCWCCCCRCSWCWCWCWCWLLLACLPAATNHQPVSVQCSSTDCNIAASRVASILQPTATTWPLLSPAPFHFPHPTLFCRFFSKYRSRYLRSIVRKRGPERELRCRCSSPFATHLQSKYHVCTQSLLLGVAVSFISCPRRGAVNLSVCGCHHGEKIRDTEHGRGNTAITFLHATVTGK